MNDNLLVDPLIRVRTREGVAHASLPGVLHLLAQDLVADFPGLRPHQRHPWHAFLCQLAVMALEGAGEASLEGARPEADWRDLLRSLTPNHHDDAPWRLAVADLSVPAFLQPPVPEGSLESFTGMVDSDNRSPFDLDVLVTSKEHGEKAIDGLHAQQDDWVVGLTMLQTFSGFLGQGNYGIARQNGGFAARPGVSLTFSRRPGLVWRRDSAILLHSLDSLRGEDRYHASQGERLLWLKPWGGGKDESLPLAALHPLFIEVCRRVRLVREPSGGLLFRAKGTKGPRVDAKAFSGAVGDPWIPVNVGDKNGPKAYNQKPHYSVAHQVLFDGGAFQPSLLQQVHESDPTRGATLAFRVFSRTQGGSDGYHERFIPVPGAALGFLGQRRDVAAGVAKNMAGMARDARLKVLRPAVLLLMQAAKESPEFKQPETALWAARFTDTLDQCVDEAFFPALWNILDEMGDGAPGSEMLQPWSRFLVERVRAEFARACAGLPISSALRYRAMAKAENLLEGSLRKNLIL